MGVDIDGLEATLSNAETLGDTLQRQVADEINKVGLRAVREAKKTMTVNQSVSTGLARTTVRLAKRAAPGDLEAIVAAGGPKTEGEGSFDYTLAIEFGTDPHFPPVEALTGKPEPLDEWVRREGLASGDEVNRVAFLIARKISQVGTRAAPFMRPTVKTMRPIARRRLQDITKSIQL